MQTLVESLRIMALNYYASSRSRHEGDLLEEAADELDAKDELIAELYEKIANLEAALENA